MSGWRNRHADFQEDKLAAEATRTIGEVFNAHKWEIGQSANAIDDALSAHDLELRQEQNLSRHAGLLNLVLDYYTQDAVSHPAEVLKWMPTPLIRASARLGEHMAHQIKCASDDTESYALILRDRVAIVQFMRNALCRILVRHIQGFDPPENFGADYSIGSLTLAALARQNELDRLLPGYYESPRSLINLFNDLSTVEKVLGNISEEKIEAAIAAKKRQIERFQRF